MLRTVCLMAGFALSPLLLAGCNSGGDDAKPLTGVQPEVPEAAHHHHHEHGPNGGHLIELGEEEYHAELVFDPKTRKTTVYILDGEAKSPAPIEAAEIELHLHGDDGEEERMLTAAPLESDGEGKSSRFELAADKLPESIKTEANFEGHLHIEIAGKNYSGNIEHDHGEEGHGHDEDMHDHKDVEHKNDKD